MRIRWKRLAIVFIVLFAVAQFARGPDQPFDGSEPHEEQQRALLAASCTDATDGKMPGAYAWLRPETRLSAGDIKTICTAAR